jgi:hypothetical protein
VAQGEAPGSAGRNERGPVLIWIWAKMNRAEVSRVFVRLRRGAEILDLCARDRKKYLSGT